MGIGHLGLPSPPKDADTSLMVAATNSMSAGSALLIVGLVTIGGTLLMVLVTAMRRWSTRQWAGENPLDPSYGATLRRTLFAAARVKWASYAIGGIFLIGVGLALVGGIMVLTQ